MRVKIIVDDRCVGADHDVVTNRYRHPRIDANTGSGEPISHNNMSGRTRMIDRLNNAGAKESKRIRKLTRDESAVVAESYRSTNLRHAY